MGFGFTRLKISEVILVEPDTYEDERGFFREAYKRSAFAQVGIDRDFPQANLSESSAGVIRGLHYQRHPAAVGKLVGVARGEIFDVAVDVRPGSPTFGRWVSAELSAENGRMLFVPEGFAHGFCALTDGVLVTYLMTGEYSAEHDTGVRWDDPDLAIDWPVSDPIVSSKDRQLPFLKDTSDGLAVSVGAHEEARP
jgi:dTDP-4-dehydrorhamnose 3,5-epimerase